MTKGKPPEPVAGSYTPIPHAVLDAPAFTGASYRAKAMLFEFVRQHNGRNNGRLQATSSWLTKRGWRSKEAISKAVLELEQRGLVILTKRGGLNAGPSWFALTWLQVTDFSGLEIKPKSYWPGAWAKLDVTATRVTTRRVQKREKRPAGRGSADPVAGAGKSAAAPVVGSKTADFAVLAAPVAGDNECCQLPARIAPMKNRKRDPLTTPLCIKLVIDNDRGAARRVA